MKTHLGIDYGRKHIGIALADSPLARPLVTLNAYTIPKAVSTICDFVDKYQAEAVVLGIPGGALDAEIHKFGKALSDSLGFEVAYHEEDLSTKEAIRALREAGASRAKLQNEHMYAACLILEDYIETAKNTG